MYRRIDIEDALLRQAQNLLRDGHELEAVLRLLRRNDCNILQSIKATKQLTGVSLGEAKRTVHDSETWRDRRAEFDAFHRSVVEALDELESEAASIATPRESDRARNAALDE